MKMVLMLGVVSSVAAVAAPGQLVRAEALPAEVRGQYEMAIARAKRSGVAAFKAVASVRESLGSLDAKKRGRLAPVSPMLKSLPEGKVGALVEAAVFEGEVAEGLAPSALLAWHVGLLEALGFAREVSLQPLFALVLATDARPEVLRAAAEGVGRLGTDEALELLLLTAKGEGGAARAAELGLGDCRRARAAEALGRAYGASSDASHRLSLLRAMARLGSPWAWRTPQGKPPEAEATAIRESLAGTLVRAYLRGGGDERQGAKDALLQLQAPESLMLLAAHRHLDTSAADALSRTLSVSR